MATYNVFLTDVFGQVQIPNHLAIRNQLKGYLDPSAFNQGFTEGAEVFWIPGDFFIADEFIQVHILPLEISAVKKMTSATTGDPLAAGHRGLTRFEPLPPATPGGAPGPETFLSEVYVDGQNTDMIAKLIYHECMHNKLRADNQMHTQGGLASAVINPTTAIARANIDTMSANLKKKRPQWPNVFPLLLSHRVRRDAGDPTWWL